MVQDEQDIIAQAVAEGLIELEKEEMAKQAKKSLCTPAQRYQLAHHQVLSDLPRLRRKELERCIKEKDYENRIFVDFAKEVARIAEENE